MRNEAGKIMTSSPGKPTAWKVLEPLAERMSLGDRLDPLWAEMMCVLLDKHDAETQSKLPSYCCNILERFRRTYFGAFPSFSDTVQCDDPSKLAGVKSLAEAKRFIKFDWYRFGKAMGVFMRILRFLDLEIENQVKSEGMWNMEPACEQKVLDLIGPAWLEKRGLRVADIAVGEVGATLTKAMASSVSVDRSLPQQWSETAFQWGPDAMAEMSRGMAEGIKGFIGENGQLAGETTRASNYVFFLILWPEIKDFLASDPLPDRTKVFEWIEPFRDAGFVSLPDIECFRDFCESIGLKFAGRLPKKH
jgi:hypothetical protein